MLTCGFVFEGSAPLLGHRLRRLRFASGDTGCGPDRDRAWHLWSSSSREESPRLRSALGLRPRLSPRYARPSLRSAVTPFNAAMLPRLSLAIRVAMPRRRNTGSLPHSRLSAQSANRIPACHSAQRSVTLPASSPHVKPLQATTTITN